MNDQSIEKMTLEQKAHEVLSYAYGGEHHIPAKPHNRGHFFEISVPAGIATFDGDTLTRLVVGAHCYCVRVEIAGSGGPRRIKLYFHDRQRAGRLFERHPTSKETLHGLAICNCQSLRESTK